MRSFTDGEGRAWDATVGRESWGAVVLLLAPRAEGGVRVAPLAAETVRDAERELATMSEQALREQLAASRAWEG
ncbi:MAG TPA: hypothetical protein VF615_18140 [Longimicrobiaceae bacterium]|jgi:hypothetical protein